MVHIFTKTAHNFEGKHPEENVVIFLHRHWYALLKDIVLYLALGCLPLIAIPIALVAFSQFNFGLYIFFFASVFYAFLWYGVCYTLTMYLLDSWIVTDERILDNIQHGFFRRDVSELNLSRIQDISVDVRGFIPTFLDFGDVEIQSAGTVNKFVFKQVPHPYKVKDEIISLVRQHQKDFKVTEQNTL